MTPTVPISSPAPSRLPSHLLLLLLMALLPYYAMPFRVDVLDGETSSHLFRALGGVATPSFNMWFGGPYIRPIAFNLWTLLSYTLFKLDAFGWHLLVVLGYFATTYQIARLYLKLSGSPVASIVGAAFWSLHFANNHVLFVTNGGNFIHILAFVVSVRALLRYIDTLSVKHLWWSCLFYLVALYSNDISPLFIACYCLIIFLYPPRRAAVWREAMKSLTTCWPHILTTIPYGALLLAKAEVLPLRDPAHRINLDFSVFKEALVTYLHWLPQVPSPYWQDVVYRQPQMRPWTGLMLALSFGVAIWTLGALARWVWRSRCLLSECPKHLLLAVVLGGVLLLPFCFGQFVPHHYVLLSLIFYSYVLGVALEGIWAAIGTRLRSRWEPFAGRLLVGAVLCFLSAHAYRHASVFHESVNSPTGHLFVNNRAVYSALQVRARYQGMRYDLVCLNLEEPHFRYHFQGGTWFRMYREGFQLVKVINRADVRTAEELVVLAQAEARKLGIAREAVRVLYFRDGTFARDLSDLL